MLTDEEIIEIRNRAKLNDNRQIDPLPFARDVIKAALAKALAQQEPIGKICKSAECGGVDFYFDKIPDGETMLYSEPKPAQAAIPDGYCLAPKEPTESMLDAGVAMALQVSVHGEGGWSKYLRGLYKQMLSA